MEQGTQEWKEWRRGGIGGSDAPAILGLSEKSDILDIFLDKVYGIEKPVPDFISRWGREIEAKVRARYSLKTDCDFKPAQAEIGFLRASADGWNSLIKVGIEIKGCSESNAKSENIPEKFMVQCQQNIKVFGAKYWILLRSHNGIEITENKIIQNKRYWGKCETKLRKFWERVERVKALPTKSIR